MSRAYTYRCSNEAGYTSKKSASGTSRWLRAVPFTRLSGTVAWAGFDRDGCTLYDGAQYDRLIASVWDTWLADRLYMEPAAGVSLCPKRLPFDGVGALVQITNG